MAFHGLLDLDLHIHLSQVVAGYFLTRTPTGFCRSCFGLSLSRYSHCLAVCVFIIGGEGGLCHKVSFAIFVSFLILNFDLS